MLKYQQETPRAMPDSELSSADTKLAPASPKKAWGEFEVVEASTAIPFWQEALLWPVNRTLDLVDAFKIDLGVGATYGGVLRLSRHMQAGYRKHRPGSLRVGFFGRRMPLMLEKEDEFGFGGESYHSSSEREVCGSEIGLGLDLFLLSGYGGICLEELFDFAAGIVFLDPKDDDLR